MWVCDKVVMSGLAALSVLGLLGGCAAPYRRDDGVMQLVRSGEYGRARERVLDQLGAGISRDDRSYTLERMKLLTLGVDDGVTDATEVAADQVYDLLRTQGLNDDKTVATFLFGEGGTRIYKGEPYEQALAYTYVALFDGMMGEWGNVRASANDSLFLLRDFTSGGREGARGRGRGGAQETSDDEVRGADSELPESLAYTAIQSDFEMGLILRAAAAVRLGEREDAAEAAGRLKQVAPRLSGLADQIVGGGYDTVLVAAWGTAPRKVGTGPDNVVAAYMPTTQSDESELLVRVGGAGGSEQRVPIATDVNRLARDVRWRNLEDMRRAKSAIGDALVVGGAVVASSSKDDGAQLAGLGAILAGAIVKATSGVDERHNEIFPQRMYVALLDLPEGGASVDLMIEGKPSSRVILPMVTPDVSDRSQGGGLRLALVRMPMSDTSWAASGRVLYNNDVTPGAAGDTLPFVLGGRCVRTPSAAAMESYYRAGLPRSVSLNELIDLYREEGIEVVGESAAGMTGRHILEGGNWLFTPDAGSAGFARLYGREQGAWRLRSGLGSEIVARMSGEAVRR
jgi:hypothetical protein